MTIWKKHISLAKLNATSANTLIEHLNISYTHFDDFSLTAAMPVTSNVHQPLGMLHGGASVVLIETVGSVAANLCVGAEEYCVGLEVNANHIRSIRQGMVFAKAKSVHLGGKTQVWHIEIKNEADELICVGRLTMMVLTHHHS